MVGAGWYRPKALRPHPLDPATAGTNVVRTTT